jgi:hypothetical protein
MPEYPKRIKKALREIAAVAHERAVRDHLSRLALDFDRWKSGELGTWDLVDLVHRFHNGPDREMYIFYTEPDPVFAVVRGLFDGFLKEDEIPGDVLEAIGPVIAALRDPGRGGDDRSGHQGGPES